MGTRNTGNFLVITMIRTLGMSLGELHLREGAAAVAACVAITGQARTRMKHLYLCIIAAAIVFLHCWTVPHCDARPSVAYPTLPTLLASASPFAAAHWS